MIKPIVTPIFQRPRPTIQNQPPHLNSYPVAQKSNAGQSLANAQQTQLEHQYQQAVTDQRKLTAITENAPAANKNFWQTKTDLNSRRLDQLQSQLNPIDNHQKKSWLASQKFIQLTFHYCQPLVSRSI